MHTRQVSVLANLSKINWLRISPIHCEDLPWWQEFNIYQETRNRRPFIGVGTPPEKPPKTYQCPLLELKRYYNLLNDPFINSHSDIARELEITRARVTQVMGLLKLAPEIREELLGFQDHKVFRYFSEHRLRPFLIIKDSSIQIREFNKMKEKIRSLSKFTSDKSVSPL